MQKQNITEFNWLIKKLFNESLRQNFPAICGVVYDFGCGTRPYEADILQHAKEYIGIDWDKTQHVLQADIVADMNKPLPIKSGVADTVVSFQVLEHLCEPQTMLNEAYRILKPEANILITVPFQWWMHEAPYDYFRYTRHGLEYMFTKAGFTDVIVSEVGGFWSTWILKFNYQTNRCVKGPQSFRWLLRLVLFPIWFANQHIACFLDKYWNAPQEASGYTVTARKP